MFYHSFLYVREGNLAKVWLASHMIRKLSAAEIRHANISLSADELRSGKQGPLALRLCGQLLLGLARIYELKVGQAYDQAMSAKIHMLVPNDERVAAKKKRKARAAGDDEGDDEAAAPLEARREDLRGKPSAINAAASSDRFDDLGQGYEDMDLDAMMDEGLAGMELREAMEGMGPAHITLDTSAHSLEDVAEGSGLMQLTQNKSYSGSVADNRSVYDGEDGRVSPAPAEENELDFDQQLDLSVAGGRAADLASDNGLGLDTSAVSNLNKSQHIGKLGLDEGLDFGGADDGFGEEIPADREAATPVPAAASERRKSTKGDVDAMDAEVDAALADVLSKKQALAASKKQSLKERASRKRAKNAYVPEIDEVTEISSSILKEWLSDASSTLRLEGDRPSLLKPQMSLTERRTKEAQAFMQTKDKVNPWYAPVSMSGASLGPALAASIRASYTTAPRLPGLPYRLAAASQAASAAQPAVPGTPLSHDGLAGVEDQELDFGGAGGEDVFDFGGGDATEIPQQEEEQQDAEAAAEAEAIEAEMPEAAADLDAELDAAAAHASFLSSSVLAGDDAAAIREKQDAWSDAEARAFFGENGARPSTQRESVESGWSRRTVAFHKKLQAEFKALPPRGPKDVKLLHVVDTHSKATAAACLYQTLVLASSGFIRPTQEEHFGEIKIAKTGAFDSKKLPAVPSQSQPSNNNTSSSNADDTEMSPAF